MRKTALLLVLVLAPLAGCIEEDSLESGIDKVGGPGFDIQRSDFYHSYYADGETYTDAFAWENPSGRAHVEVRHAIAAGAERVSILDAKGASVWHQEFLARTRQGQFHPGSGEPGTWTIIIERERAAGQFDLHVWRGHVPRDG